MHPLSRAALIALLAPLAVFGCGDANPLDRFAGSGPAFDPVAFWTGHARSWGVMENRAGAPTGIVQTDCVGVAEGADGLHMMQTLTLPDGSVQHRDWHMRRIAPGRFAATANDMVGSATGEAKGRAFHWTWVLATRPGNALFDVTLSQWMYLMDDGGLVNRTTISKLGFTVAEVTEQFQRVP